MADSTQSPPKRKRSQPLNGPGLEVNTATFSFAVHVPGEDGKSSPQSTMAHQFRGLALDSGGGASGRGPSTSPEPQLGADDPDAPQAGARKRVKFPDYDMTDAPLGTALSSSSTPFSSVDGPEGDSIQARLDPANTSLDQHNKTFTTTLRFAPQPEFLDAGDPGKIVAASRSVSPRPKAQAVSVKGRSRKRAGTPPLTGRTNPATAEPGSDGPVITDPVRASLTWHEDEITIYDPDDSDDDGTGINGIGFKPTSAIAHARTAKRKQQLAEYRKREEREARTQRSQRRRRSPAPALLELEARAERRRVRFMENSAEPEALCEPALFV